jgi:hypothetical protein
MDAMSISQSLHYSEKMDLLRGFEDTGDGKPSSQIADQTLVVSVRGLRAHWKQVSRV